MKLELKLGVMEKGCQSSDPNIIELLGPDAIKDFPRFQYLDVSGVQTFDEAFGEDTACFYVLEKYNNSSLLYYERGLGYVESGNLVRDIPLAQGLDPTQLEPPSTVRPLFECDSDELLVATAKFPTSYLEALLSPHSVLTSTDEIPQITVMPSGSILGRLDGNIEAIEAIELAESTFLKNTLSNYTGNVSAKGLTLAPITRPTSPQNGTIYFIDDGVGGYTLEYYNSGWTIL